MKASIKLRLVLYFCGDKNPQLVDIKVDPSSTSVEWDGESVENQDTDLDGSQGLIRFVRILIEYKQGRNGCSAGFNEIYRTLSLRNRRGNKSIRRVFGCNTHGQSHLRHLFSERPGKGFRGTIKPKVLNPQEDLIIQFATENNFVNAKVEDLDYLLSEIQEDGTLLHARLDFERHESVFIGVPSEIVFEEELPALASNLRTSKNLKIEGEDLTTEHDSLRKVCDASEISSDSIRACPDDQYPKWTKPSDELQPVLEPFDRETTDGAGDTTRPIAGVGIDSNDGRLGDANSESPLEGLVGEEGKQPLARSEGHERALPANHDSKVGDNSAQTDPNLRRSMEVAPKDPTVHVLHSNSEISSGSLNSAKREVAESSKIGHESTLEDSKSPDDSETASNSSLLVGKLKVPVFAFSILGCVCWFLWLRDKTGPEQPLPKLAYLLNAEEQIINRDEATIHLRDSDRDVIVLDTFFDGERWVGECLDTIRQGKAGRRLLAYVCVGEAATHQPHWQTEWVADAPEFLGGPVGADIYSVNYWSAEWQTIVVSNIRNALRQGFDGLLLGQIDTYLRHEHVDDEWIENRMNPATGQTFRKDMIGFIQRITDEAHAENPDVVVVPLNGTELLEWSGYANLIDGIVVSRLFAVDGSPRVLDEVQWIRTQLETMKPEQPVFVIEYCERKDLRDFAIEEAKNCGYSLLLTDLDFATLGEAFLP